MEDYIYKKGSGYQFLILHKNTVNVSCNKEERNERVKKKFRKKKIYNYDGVQMHFTQCEDQSGISPTPPFDWTAKKTRYKYTDKKESLLYISCFSFSFLYLFFKYEVFTLCL